MSFLISVGNLITCMLGLKCIEKANIHSTGADKIFSRDNYGKERSNVATTSCENLDFPKLSRREWSAQRPSNFKIRRCNVRAKLQVVETACHCRISKLLPFSV